MTAGGDVRRFCRGKNIPTSHSERVRVKMPPVDDTIGVELLAAE